MKKLALLILLLYMALCVGANNKFDYKRYKAELVKYITNKACLTQAEAAKFFPVYNEMQQKQRVLFNELKKNRRVKPASDAEYKKVIRRHCELEIQIKEVQQQYHNKFLKILPAKKVYDVIKAEDRFHREAFKKLMKQKSKQNNKK